METELEKQQSGKWYNPATKEIIDLQNKSRQYNKSYNLEMDLSKRNSIMKKWFGTVGENCHIEPVFYCDFGCNLFLGDNVYMNANCTILDSAKVIIGDNTMFGPNVQICTPYHSTIPEERKKEDFECAKIINIGKDCWLGAGVIILPGVTIGDGSTIGAGSIVTKDVPPRSVAVGSPCKVIKTV